MYFNSKIFGQLSIDAGQDIFLCIIKDSFILSPINSSRNYKTLGGNPTVLSGKSPFRFKWECVIKTNLKTKPYIYASEFLDDTTIPNPKIKLFILNESIKMFLTVTDSLNNISKDSTIFFISSYSFFAGIIPFYKKQNDTATLDIGSGFILGGKEPKQYFWSPATFLINSNSKSPKIWDTTSGKNYGYYIIDSTGCKSSHLDVFEIQILTSSLSYYKINNLILNYHNPVNKNSIYKISNNEMEIKKVLILNSTGQVIYTSNEIKDLSIGALTNEKGVYYLIFFVKDDSFKTLKIVWE